MTGIMENINKKRFYKADHTTYGGELSLFDFDGHHTMTTMASKLIKDNAFDKQCKRNIELRELNETRGS